MTDHVNHPAHYGGDVPYEAIKVIHAWDLGFDLGNAVKYISRAGKKDPAKTVEDLRKAIFYIEHHIKDIEKDRLDEALVGGIAMQDSIYAAAEERLSNSTGESIEEAAKPKKWTLEDGHIFQAREDDKNVCVFCDGWKGQHLNLLGALSNSTDHDRRVLCRCALYQLDNSLHIFESNDGAKHGHKNCFKPVPIRRRSDKDLDMTGPADPNSV